MPRYDYRCHTCDATFEVSRPLRLADTPTPCPTGHDDTVKLLSTVAVTGASTTSSSGGCCGGACGCSG